MSATLRAQQEALVALLFSRTAPASRGLDAYRGNGHAMAQRALAAAYPAVAQLLGESSFHALARELWVTDPPARGDLAQWGASLPVLIERLPDLSKLEPYLADVARVEWEVHRIATQADAAFDPVSFELLTARDPGNVTLRLSPCAFIESRFAAASIVLAHHGELSFETAGQRLRAGVAETALAWRAGLAPRVRIAHEGEREFVAALQEGAALADSLQSAPRFDFGAWLTPAVQEQFVLGASLLPTRTPS